VDESVESWSVKYGRLPRPNDQRNLVGSVLKAIVLIESFLGGQKELTLSELGQRSGYPAPTVHRLLATLEAAGWVSRGPAGGYQLSLHLAEISRHVLSGLNLRDAAHAPMQDLTKRTGETSYLVVREADHAVCVERVESYTMVRVMSWDVGSVLPLYAGAAPLALLAFTPAAERERLLHSGPLEAPIGTMMKAAEVEKRLAHIRQVGSSISAEETIPGIASVGAPIFGRDGEIVGAVSVGGMAATITGDRIDSISAAVREAGQEISAAMGFAEAYPPEIA
jgi:DNA-binding IclR family transcriptional regulator